MTGGPPPVVWRMRLAATSLLLVAVAFVSSPGRIVGDTKADLVLDPGAFLQRALSLWDPAGSFGQVQNQAYGYLFPMGPFFWMGHAAQVDPWVVQRLWWSLVLVTAFLGMVKLCSVLGLGTPTARLLGGLAFALSPRVMTLLGSSSIEIWPSAVAPWVLVPLVIGLRRGDPRLMAALSALAVTCIGGVNAAATSAVLPLGVIWLLMAPPSRRRRSLIVWWPGFVALGTLWWLGPLFLLGSYSPPFLDFIESASTTTFAATAFDALRGTTNWIPYLDGTAVAGGSLLTSSTIIVNSAVVLVLGMWGISRKDNPVGRFLLVSLAVGLALVTVGHAGTNLGSGAWQSLLDGVLAPLRNTHKFDPVVRIPLVLGLVHVVGVLGRRAVGPARRRLPLAGVTMLAGAALLGSTVPAWTGDLANRGSYTAVPAYWSEATDWLEAHAGDQNALLLPGASFGTYLWGSPRDEVAQAFLSSPWSVRNAVPLTPAGSIRTLDAYESAFGSGVGSRALHDSLVRSGIRYLVVRQDIADSATTDPELVESTLRSTPGISVAKSFGPVVGSPATQRTDDGDVVFVNAGRQSRHRAIQVFEVEGVDSSRARVQSRAGTPVVVGSPDALLAQDGMFGPGTDVLLAPDAGSAKGPGPVVLTDTDRRQEVAFGRVIRNRSASLAASERYRIDRPVHDYLTTGQARWQTVPELIGARSITASSSQSDVTQASIDVTRHPWAAFDGDRRTAWVAGDGGSAAWLDIRFDEPTSVTGLSVVLTRGQPARRLTVRTDAGTERSKVATGTRTVLDTPVGLTRRLRITGASFGLEPLSIDEVSIPDVTLARPLRLPALPASWGPADEIVLTAPSGRPACRTVRGVNRCTPGPDGLGEDGRAIDRLVDVAAPASYAAGVSVAPQDSTALSDALSGSTRLHVSSTGSKDASAGILAAVDGDPQTGWIAALKDLTPDLTLTFDEPRRLDTLVLRADPTLAASAPRRARLVFDGDRSRRVRFDTDGRARFPATTASSVRIEVTAAYVRSSLAFDGTGSGLPLGISEIEVPGSGRPLAAGADAPVRLACGSGPSLRVDSTTYETRVTTSRRAALSRRPLTTSLCGTPDIALTDGEHRLTATASAAFRPLVVRLSRSDQAYPTSVEVPTSRPGQDRISVGRVPGTGSQLLTLSQNVNRGWVADAADAVTVNGWQQGFEVEGGDRVDVRFAPASLYRGVLLVGAVGVLALVALLWRLRRTTRFVDQPRSPRRRLRAVVGAIVLAVPLVTIGGVGGALAALVAMAATLVVGRRRDASWVAPALVLSAGLAYVLRPWTSPDGWAGALDWPQWCVVASLGAAVGVLFGREMRTFLSRIAGRSTSR